MRVSILFLCLLACGCGGATNSSKAPEAKAGEEGEKPAAAQYQGKTAAEWDQALAVRDEKQRLQAATALWALGDDAVPYLVERLKGKDRGSQESLANQPDCKVLHKHRDVFLPLLTARLTDQEANQEALAEMLVRCFPQEARAALTRALESETNPERQRLFRDQLRYLSGQ